MFLFTLFCLALTVGVQGQNDNNSRKQCSSSDLIYQCRNIKSCSRFIDDLEPICDIIKKIQPGALTTAPPPTQKLTTKPLTTSKDRTTVRATTEAYEYTVTTFPLTEEDDESRVVVEDDSYEMDNVLIKEGDKRIGARIIERPVNITIPPGATARFWCKSEGAPAPVTTVTRRTEIEVSDQTSKVVGERVTAVSVIQEIENVNIQHEGWYRCTASNGWGIDYADAYLTVRDLCVGVVCGNGETCQADYLVGAADCVCRECSPNEYNPVCGDNCEVYFSPCLMDYENCKNETDISIASYGFCPQVRKPDIQISAGSYLYYSVGDSMELLCIVSRDTTPFPSSVHWTRTTSAGTLKVSAGEVLRIESLTTEDDGMYQCVVEQCRNKYSSRGSVQVVVADDITPSPTPDNLETSKKTCSVYGDPHFLTFDGYAYDFMGECHYVLAMDCLFARWIIYGQFERCSADNVRGSCLSAITIFSGRNAVELQRGWIINDQGSKMNITESQTKTSGPMTITFDGRHILVKIAGSDVEVWWDGLVSVHVTAPSGSEVCGLCGNNDDDPSNDLDVGRSGVRTESGMTRVDVADSWAVDRLDQCEKRVPVTAKKCTATSRNQAKRKCERAFNLRSLRECSLDKTSFVSACVYDVCSQLWVADRVKPECIAIANYIQRCAFDKAGKIPRTDWEGELGCPRLYELQDITVSEGCPQDINTLLRRKVRVQ